MGIKSGANPCFFKQWGSLLILQDQRLCFNLRFFFDLKVWLTATKQFKLNDLACCVLISKKIILIG